MLLQIILHTCVETIEPINLPRTLENLVIYLVKPGKMFLGCILVVVLRQPEIVRLPVAVERLPVGNHWKSNSVVVADNNITHDGRSG